MAIPKKIKDEEPKAPKFKKSEFHAFFDDYYYNEIIPYFLEHQERILTLTNKWVERTQTKEDWNELYKYLIDIMDIFYKDGREPYITYHKRYLIAKYHSVHTQYYNLIADKEIKCMNKCIELSNKYIDFKNSREEHPKEYRYWSGNLIIALQHFWYYMNAKEKLGVID